VFNLTGAIAMLLTAGLSKERPADDESRALSEVRVIAAPFARRPVATVRTVR
jgi:hypothetical protein